MKNWRVVGIRGDMVALYNLMLQMYTYKKNKKKAARESVYNDEILMEILIEYLMVILLGRKKNDRMR